MGNLSLGLDRMKCEPLPDHLRLSKAVLGPDFVEITDADTGKDYKLQARDADGVEDALDVIRRRLFPKAKDYKIDPLLRLRVLVHMQEFIASNGLESDYEGFEDYARDLLKERDFRTTSLKVPNGDNFDHFVVHDGVFMYIDPARSHFSEQIAEDIYDLLTREFEKKRTIPPQQFCKQLAMNIDNRKLTTVVFLKLRNRLAFHIYSRGDEHRSLLNILETKVHLRRRLFDHKRRGQYRKRKDMQDPDRSASHDVNRESMAIKLRAAPEEVALIDLFAQQNGESRTVFMLKAAWDRIWRKDPGLASEFEANPEGFVQLLEAGKLDTPEA